MSCAGDVVRHPYSCLQSARSSYRLKTCSITIELQGRSMQPAGLYSWSRYITGSAERNLFSLFYYLGRCMYSFMYVSYVYMHACECSTVGPIEELKSRKCVYVIAMYLYVVVRHSAECECQNQIWIKPNYFWLAWVFVFPCTLFYIVPT